MPETDLQGSASGKASDKIILWGIILFVIVFPAIIVSYVYNNQYENRKSAKVIKIENICFAKYRGNRNYYHTEFLSCNKAKEVAAASGGLFGPAGLATIEIYQDDRKIDRNVPFAIEKSNVFFVGNNIFVRALEWDTQDIVILESWTYSLRPLLFAFYVFIGCFLVWAQLAVLAPATFRGHRLRDPAPPKEGAPEETDWNKWR